ncbi:MAG TPA: hypothetical protein DD473_23985 [Planctomycetaceae bacterium]|nr:hypothetical protein [Planctomycetaceae bacterium]
MDRKYSQDWESQVAVRKFLGNKIRMVSAFCCGSLLFIITGWMNLHGADDNPPSTIRTVSTEVRREYHRSNDRALFLGARACLDCHRSEFASWLSTEHFNNTVNRFELNKDTIAKRYFEKHGSLDRCYQCHTAPKEQRFGRKFVETGTSCESCHGASGGEGGWLNRHAVYGPNTTRLEQETSQHFQSRIDFCDQAGMIRPGRQYLMAKQCMSCHLIGDPELISEEIGHPVGFDKFELIPYLSGEVRHNFHLNQRNNAKAPTLDTLRRGLSPTQRQRVYMIVEQLARMEVAFNYLANLQNEEAFENRYADDLIGIVEDGADFLDEYVEVLLEPDDSDVPPLNEEAVESLTIVLDEFEKFDDLDEPTRAAAADSARVISKAANQFMAALGNGSKLEALDVFFEDTGNPVGDVLQP